MIPASTLPHPPVLLWPARLLLCLAIALAAAWLRPTMQAFRRVAEAVQGAVL